jgi:hypothetical protein
MPWRLLRACDLNTKNRSRNRNQSGLVLTNKYVPKSESKLDQQKGDREQEEIARTYESVGDGAAAAAAAATNQLTRVFGESGGGQG